MKKLVKLMVAAIMVLISINFVTATAKENKVYTKTATVTSQDEIVDSRGEAWGYSDIPYDEGTILLVTFDDNGTTDITDDMIINLQIN